MALRWDGSTGFFEQTAAPLPSNNWTMCCWIRPATIPAPGGFDMYLSAGATAAASSTMLGFCGAATVGLCLADDVGSGGKVDFPITAKAGEWWFVAMSHDGVNIRGWSRRFDWRSLQRATKAKGAMTVTAFRFGDTTFDGTDFADGRAAGLRIWSRLLSTAELLKESFSLLPASRARLYACAQENSRVDLSGFGRTFAQTGTVNKEPGPPIPLFRNQPVIIDHVNAPVVDDGSPWILLWQDDAEPNEEDVVDDQQRPFTVEDAPVVTDDSETRPHVDLDADAGADEPELETQTLTVEESPQLVVDVDPELPEADDAQAGAQITVDAETPTLLADDALEEPDQDADTPAPIVEDAQQVITSDVGLELTEGADEEPEFGDDAFIVVVLDDQTTLVLTEQDDEPELDTVTLEAPATQPDDPAPPDNIEPALLAWVDLDEFHPELEFGLEILIGPTDNPPAQTNYVWIHRARRRGNR